MELKAPPADFCITHPNNPACENVPALPLDNFTMLFILLLAGFYIAINELTNKKK